MNDGLLNRVKSSLRSRLYHVNDSWLKECVEYYISEQNDTSLSAVQAFVTSQWLLSDLREINNEQGYLPADFIQQHNIVLPGKYIIQVDKMCDISQSKYSQLQKIRNVSEINVKATTIETPAWEPKGKRMIQMWLTDGIQDFTAIEYKPIKKLKDTLLPGFKIMIIGPVMSRRGVIMLKEENYEEIGGEVDSLLKANALENVLARALGMEENETPYAEDNRENNGVQADIGFPEDEFDIDFDELTHIERLSMENKEPPVAVAPRANDPGPRNDTPGRRSALASKTTVKPIGNTAQKNTMTNYFSRENGMNPQSNSQKENFRINDEGAGENGSKISSRTRLKPLISQTSNFQSQSSAFAKFYDPGIEDKTRGENGLSGIQKLPIMPSTSHATAERFPEDDCFDGVDFAEEMDEYTLRKDNGTAKILSKPVTSVENRFDSPIQPAAMTSVDSPDEKSPTLSTGKRSADMMSPLSSSPKMICLKNTRQSSAKQNRKITEFTARITPKEDMPPKICDTICDVLAEPASETGIYRRVRGKVIQVGKLTKQDKNWDLKATICDDTASIEISFSSQILEGLIGFTVSEFLDKKKMRKTSPEVEQFLRGGFRTAENRIKQMDVLMELELSTDNKTPKVVNTTELTDEQKLLIEKRIKMMAV